MTSGLGWAKQGGTPRSLAGPGWAAPSRGDPKVIDPVAELGWAKQEGGTKLIDLVAGLGQAGDSEVIDLGAGLGWAGLGWAGLGWPGLGWAEARGGAPRSLTSGLGWAKQGEIPRWSLASGLGWVGLGQAGGGGHRGH